MWMRVLGPLSLEAAGVTAALGGPKQRLVLALLALRAQRPVGVDELIEDVWGEDPPGRPRKTLQVYVANLRRALGEGDRLTSGPAGYTLRLGPDELDLAQFDRLLARARDLRGSAAPEAVRAYEEALALWSPPALADLRGFEAVAALLRPHEERRAEALAELMTLRLESGEDADLVGPLLALVEDDPWQERWWWLLIQAYYRSGRQADALETYRRVRRQLRDELGIDPGPELQALAAAVLRQDLPATGATRGAARSAGSVTDPGAPPLPSAPPSAAERRTATFVAFSVARLTRSAAAADPEDLAELPGLLAERVAEVVGRHGGTVEGAEGSDHVVGVFGFPRAAEDDTLRAVRAALEVVAAGPLLPGQHHGPELGVGVDTGVALFQPGRQATGRARGGAVALAEAAGPAQVLASALTASLVEGAVRVAADGRTVPGLDGAPVLLLGTTTGAPDAAGGDLVGREEELDAVREALAARGPAVVLLHGEPGVGRTSLLAAVLGRLRAEGGEVVLLQADRHRRARSLHPFLRARAAHEEAGTEQGAPAADAAADAQADAAELAEPVAAARAGLLAWLRDLTRTGPVHVAVDDLHDVDPETLGLLESLPDEVGLRSLVLTSRTRSLPPGLDQRARRIGVGRLDRADAQALVRAVARPARLRNATVRGVVEAAAGHPWHLTELALSAARGARPDSGGLVEEVPSAVPVSLQASLLARLDALGPRRALVQRLAVCRGEFSADLAVLVAGDATPDGRAADDPQGPAAEADQERAVARARVAAELERLRDEGLLRSTTRRGVTVYRFAHALLEDLAYTSLPRSVREDLHRRVADGLVRAGGGDADALAQHLQLSGRPLEAAAQWVQAAAAARTTGDFALAAQQARRSVQLVEAGGEVPGPAGDELALRAHLLFATSSKMVLGYHPDIDASLAKATGLAIRLSRPDLLVQVFPAMISTLQAAGDYAQAAAYGADSLARLPASIDPGLRAKVAQFHWATLVWMGRLPEADEVLDTVALLAPQPVVPGPMRALQAVARCAGLSLGGLAALTRGRTELAWQLLDAAEESATASGLPDASCLVHVILAVAHQFSADAEATRRHAERTAELAIGVGNDWWFVHAQGLLGWAVGAQGNPAEGAAIVVEALENLGQLRQHRPHLLGLLADVERRAGELDAALRHADAAVALAEEIDEGFYLPLLHLVRADVLEGSGLDEEAVLAREEARAVADRQGQGWFSDRARLGTQVPA